jgi:hypothetical protein
MIKVEQENRELKFRVKNLKIMRKQADYNDFNRSPDGSIDLSKNVSASVSIAQADFSQAYS